MPRMQPIQIKLGDKELHIECAHQDSFPPNAALLEEEHGSAIQQRADGLITEADFHQYNTWARVCGLKEMAHKCLGCPRCQKGEVNPHTGKLVISPLRPEEIRAAPFYRNIHKGNL